MAPNEITFLIIALAFVVLVIFLSYLAYTASKTLKRISYTITTVRRQIECLGHGPRDLIRNVSEISADLSHKMKCVNPLFRSIENVSEGLECKSAAFRDHSRCGPECQHQDHSRCGSECQHQDPRCGQEYQHRDDEYRAAEIIEWALLGIALWQKYIKRR